MKTIFLAFLMAAGFFAQAQITGTADYQVLPENLAYFTATRTGKMVNLEWQTVNEQNAKGFSIQRKTSGDWESIAFVATKGLNGNSSVKQSYAYTDVNAFKGISQYRVIQTTSDAKQRSGEIRAVRGESQTDKVMLYPNPSVDGRINLVFDNTASKDILVIDVAGRVVKQLNGITGTTAGIENLQPGFYTVYIANRTANEALVLKAIVGKQ